MPAVGSRIAMRRRVDVELSRSECRLLAAFLAAEGQRQFQALPRPDPADPNTLRPFAVWVSRFEFLPVRADRLLADELIAKAKRGRGCRSITVQLSKSQAAWIGEWLRVEWAGSSVGFGGVSLTETMLNLSDRLITAGTRRRGRPRRA